MRYVNLLLTLTLNLMRPFVGILRPLAIIIRACELDAIFSTYFTCRCGIV